MLFFSLKSISIAKLYECDVKHTDNGIIENIMAKYNVYYNIVFVLYANEK